MLGQPYSAKRRRKLETPLPRQNARKTVNPTYYGSVMGPISHEKNTGDSHGGNDQARDPQEMQTGPSTAKKLALLSHRTLLLMILDFGVILKVQVNTENISCLASGMRAPQSQPSCSGSLSYGCLLSAILSHCFSEHTRTV